MATFDYDLAIIGGGSAGLTGAKVGRFFAQKRIALIDKERLGGDCLYYGCVPSKALIKIARVAHEIGSAGGYGLEAVATPPALAAANDRVRSTIDRVAQMDSVAALRELGVDVCLGGGQFLDEHTVQAGDRTFTTKYALICTGSRPAAPDTPGLREAGFLTNEDVFDLNKLPRRLAVIGGGPIGCELAQALARLGAKVTVLQRQAHLLPRDDRDVVETLEQTFKDEGIEVWYETSVDSVRTEAAERIVVTSGQHTGELRVDSILVAVGRTPNVEGLNLEAAGVKYSKRGIEVNERLQTARAHIYAAGDVLGGMQFTHLAGYQGSQAVQNAFSPVKRKFNPGYIPWVTFTDPEVAHVGLTEAEAKAATNGQGRDCWVLRFPYSQVERAITDQDTVGLMKFLIDGKRRFIGCHIAGANAGELISEMTLAMNHNLTVDQVIGTVHAYPTYSFSIPYALYDYVLNENPQTIAKVGRYLSKLT